MTIQKPCACETRDLLDIGSLVDSARSNNDNALVGISSDTLASVAGTTNLTLPCGRYYFDRVHGTGDVRLKVTGSVAIFVGGSVDLDADLSANLLAGALIDIFVKQSFRTTGQVTVGSQDRPAAGRIYVGGNCDITLNDTFVGNLYAPASSVTAESSLNVWGSIFCGSIETSSETPIVRTTRASETKVYWHCLCYCPIVLGPTSPSLLDPQAIPYFLWDTRQTVAELRRILAGPASPQRDEILVRLLREANSRDVWIFSNWEQIDEAWPRIEHRLGRARPVWELLRERHLYHARAAS